MLGPLPSLGPAAHVGNCGPVQLPVGMLGRMNIIDTHVHNAVLDVGLNYTYPRAFPDLANRDWNITEFVAATGRHSGVSAVLMELDKAGDVYKESLAEARRYQQTAYQCDQPKSGCSVSAIVASAPVVEGAAVMRSFLPELLRVAPRTRGVREALWHRSPAAYEHNATYIASLRELVAYNLTLDGLCRAATNTPIARHAHALLLTGRTWRSREQCS
jgi:predicted TIM-barrel fold metal-dependent hydrolase